MEALSEQKRRATAPAQRRPDETSPSLLAARPSQDSARSCSDASRLNTSPAWSSQHAAPV